jgi:hypothetical protein
MTALWDKNSLRGCADCCSINESDSYFNLKRDVVVVVAAAPGI